MAAKSLYVCRPLLNGAEFYKWAASQGFRSVLPKNELHVTIAFSREPVEWSKVDPKRAELRLEGGRRSIEKLGDAVVLRFSAKSLADRWQTFRDAGASWDYPGYKPHVTITYKGAPRDIKRIDPYLGPLVFGPERFDEVTEDANKDIDETKMSATTTQANNAAVKFRGRAERAAPLSQTPGKPPRRISKKAIDLHRRGLISDQQRDKMTKGV